MQQQANDAIDKILLASLVKYMLPIFNKSYSKNTPKNKKKESKLEELVKDDKAKSRPIESTLLEDFINLLKKESKQDKRNPFLFSEDEDSKIDVLEFFDAKNDANGNDEEEIRYSMAFQRKKAEKGNSGYSVEIKYEETAIAQKIHVTVKFEKYSLNKDQNFEQNKQKNNAAEYSVELKREKNDKADGNYSVSLVYENNYEKERLSINYKSTIGAYLSRRQQALSDFSDRVPGKHVSTFSRNEMPGVLGFTYLGQDRMALRDDLIGKTKKMVDIHESIHTPDEYETRVLTDWIMSKKTNKYSIH